MNEKREYSGRMAEAEALLLQVSSRRPDVAAVHGMLGMYKRSLEGFVRQPTATGGRPNSRPARSSLQSACSMCFMHKAT